MTRPFSPEEPPGVDRVLADSAFLVGRGDAEDVGPLGPGVGRAARSSGGRGTISNWWTLLASVAVDGAQAVGAGVAAADDDHVLTFGAR